MEPFDESTHDEPEEMQLPLEVRVERRGDGWSVRLPLRTETVRIEKIVTPYQEVRVQARLARDVERLTDVVRREELVVRGDGGLEVEHLGGDRVRLPER